MENTPLLSSENNDYQPSKRFLFSLIFYIFLSATGYTSITQDNARYILDEQNSEKQTIPTWFEWIEFGLGILTYLSLALRLIYAKKQMDLNFRWRNIKFSGILKLLLSIIGPSFSAGAGIGEKISKYTENPIVIGSGAALAFAYMPYYEIPYYCGESEEDSQLNRFKMARFIWQQSHTFKEKVIFCGKILALFLGNIGDAFPNYIGFKLFLKNLTLRDAFWSTLIASTVSSASFLAEINTESKLLLKSLHQEKQEKLKPCINFIEDEPIYFFNPSKTVVILCIMTGILLAPLSSSVINSLTNPIKKDSSNYILFNSLRLILSIAIFGVLSSISLVSNAFIDQADQGLKLLIGAFKTDKAETETQMPVENKSGKKCCNLFSFYKKSNSSHIESNDILPISPNTIPNNQK